MYEKELEAFLEELTNLCFKHGFGITGEPQLFVLEYGIEGDETRIYRLDDEGKLQFD